MPQANTLEKRVRLTREEVIRYQLLTYAFLNKLGTLSEGDLSSLTELSLLGEVELNDFCNHIANKKIFANPQSARNSIGRSVSRDLITKSEGRRNIKIKVNPNIQLITKGYAIYLDFKFLSVES